MYEYNKNQILSQLTILTITFLTALLLLFIALSINYSKINKSLKEDNYSLRLNIKTLKNELINSRFDRDNYCKNLYEWRWLDGTFKRGSIKRLF